MPPVGRQASRNRMPAGVFFLQYDALCNGITGRGYTVYENYCAIYDMTGHEMLKCDNTFKHITLGLMSASWGSS